MGKGVFFNTLLKNLIDGSTSVPQKMFLFGISVLLSAVLAFFCNLILRKVLNWLNSTRNRYHTGISGAVKYPLFWCFFLTGIYNSCKIFQFNSAAAKQCDRWYFILMVLLILRGLLNAVNFFSEAYRRSSLVKGNIYNELLIHLLEPTVKTILWAVGILFILDNVFHFHVGTLLAGAGIASMAVAFAAQNTIANIFGAITLILDRPFLPGEKIQLKDQTGVVQTIGLRSVRLLADDGTIWTIPNKIMSENFIVNLSRRPYTRYTFTINLTYAHTPEQLQKGKELLHEIIAGNTLVNMEERPPRISFDNIGASSLDLQAVCWFHTADVAEYTRAKDEINFQILEKFNANGFDFAFPSQSIYVEKMPEAK